jgi:CDP-glucose 4,6-dehydratase
MNFSTFYKNKKVLITGNTGFKGTWMTVWLLKLGAKIVGISKDIPTNPSMYETLNLKNQISFYNLDIINLDELRKIILYEKPDIIFHLAAQAIVSTSYTNPIETFHSNVIGTINILEILRNYKQECQAIFITSDKCYDNVEWVWGYKETNSMGGKDIYSGSKAAAEMAIKSYFHSYFTKDSKVKIAIGRAGNVIGGGDWAKDRIIVDTMKAWNDGFPVEIRSPNSTRPWQHVLEPLSGYMYLAFALSNNNNLNGEAFNFGPKSEQNKTVINLLDDLGKYWDFNNDSSKYIISDNIPFHEAGLLKLNCDKALFHLKWEATLNYNENVEFVSLWYYNYYKLKSNMYDYTLLQIENYEKLAKKSEKIWTKI